MNHAHCLWQTLKQFTTSTVKFRRNVTAIWHINAFKQTSPTLFAVGILTIKFYTRDQRNEEVPHFQRHAAWSVVIAFGSLGHRSDSKDASQPKVSRKTLQLFNPTSQTLSRTAAARNIKVRTLRHPVSCTTSHMLCFVLTLTFVSPPPEKSASLLSRIFRRSCRSTKKIESYSAQFPPREWFNSKAVHLQSVGTQTLDHHVRLPLELQCRIVQQITLV